MDKEILKRCNKCGIEKPLEAFHKSNKAKHGRVYTCKKCVSLFEKKRWNTIIKSKKCRCGKPLLNNDKWCKVCYNRMRNNTQDKKKKAINYLGEKCNNCGLQTNFINVYDFHHVIPSLKKYTLSSMFRIKFSWKEVEKELDKCVLLCANCHNTIHSNSYDNDDKYWAKRRKQHKLKCINYLGGKCQYCGLETKIKEVYIFHHVNSDIKINTIGHIRGYSWDTLKKELNNCILLCHNCHRILHQKLDKGELNGEG